MSKKFDYPRDFKGIWLPKEIWLDDNLNAVDKIIFAEIYSLDVDGSDGCYASNEYLSNFCKCSVTKVSTSISKLIKRGYIKVTKTDGRTRWLKASLSKFESQNNKNKKSESQEMKESNINNKNTLDNSKANSFFTKKVRENKNKSRIDQSELEKRISNVVDDLRIDVFSDEQADNVETFMLYFIDRYAEVFGKEHPLLKENTIDDIAASVTRQICIEHENMEFDTYFEPLISDEAGETYYEEIVDMYFKTEFKQDIDYSMVHFSQKNVLVKLMGRASEKTWYQNS